MPISRRDFMKFVGVSISSLLLTNCAPEPTPTCYVPVLPPTGTPGPRSSLRDLWLSFGELARRTQEAAVQGSSEDKFGSDLEAQHRTALDQLVASGDLTPQVADLVQEAYEAAIYHVWRSNAPMTCYEPMLLDYAPVSAQVLVNQSAALDQLASQGTIDPHTLEDARKALEHDLAYYALTQAEVDALYQRITSEWQSQNQAMPTFDQVDLEITPDAQAAAEFILNLLIGK